ncbi:MAG TPA: hypothetical protein VF514_01900 [Bacteroidota bacterium]
MDIKSELLKEHSRRQADRIVSWIGNDTRRFRRLMDLFLRGEYRITQRSAMVVGICADRNPALVRPYIRRMLSRMEEPGVHVAVRRSVVRMLQHVDIPAGLLGRVATLCFGYLAAGDSSVAVKAFSMTVLVRIAEKEPDLGRELRLIIEQQLPYGSKGFCSCAARVLKGLGPG